MIENLLLQFDILWQALVAGFLILVTHVPLGREVLHRGIIFLDLAIAQMAGFGVVLANSFLFDEHSHLPQSMIAIIAAMVGAIGLYCLRNFSVKFQEAMIGICFVLSATGSILLLATNPHGTERLRDILIGQILWVRGEELIQLAMAYSLILFIWYQFRSKVGGLLFYLLFAITITLSTQVVGVYLVFASLIIPALVTLNQKYALAKGMMIGFVGYLLGLTLAAIFDLPAGATIVWSLVIIALCYQSLSITLTCLRGQK